MSRVESTAGQKPTSVDQGVMVGALLMMATIALANMRSGTPVWGWYLSSTVVPLIISWNLHNIFEIYANFAYFNNGDQTLFTYSRPFEAAFRPLVVHRLLPPEAYTVAPVSDPWWIFTTASLFYNIRYRYELGIVDIIVASPRFGVLLCSMIVSIIFIVVDVLACLTDAIILGDFKTDLDKLRRRRMTRILPLNAMPEQPMWTFRNLETERPSPWSKAPEEEPRVLLVEHSEAQISGREIV
ncbi:unnamed protein product [Clonostachys solani]|uniref:Uncharacterized protein n=1 Tax=Clonostachys solani TaxID=160281 RepID=A0A9P0EFU3_9HYPO|nr:unnamed protein product [Clonostachys solani]